MRMALQFATENGGRKSMVVFNDPRGNFTREDATSCLLHERMNLCYSFQPSPSSTGKLSILSAGGNGSLLHLSDSFQDMTRR